MAPPLNGTYFVERVWTATDRCGNSTWQTQLISIEGCPGTATLHSIDGYKFYDANGNGSRDGQEPGLPGWKIVLLGPEPVTRTTFTDKTGHYFFADLQQGSYLVAALPPLETDWQDTTSRYCLVILSDADEARDFGGLCIGGGNGRSLSFWADKSSLRILNDAKGPAPKLKMLRQLNLRHSDGSDFDPASHVQLGNWLLGVAPSNLPYKLSAELAAMALSLETGIVAGNSLIRAPGATAANALGFAAAEALVAETNRALGRPLGEAAGIDDSLFGPYQRALEAALRGANDDQAFVRSDPCPFTFGP